MCGIAGAVGSLDEAVMSAVRKMSEAQVQRGPDAYGEWHDGSNGVPRAFFAHRRLKIIDLDDAANQPMIDRDAGNVLAFNGEIYNFRELRSQLQSQGVVFQTHSDTEVLLKAYGTWGQSCLERLRGMYAFAIWDAETGNVFCARDRMGIKPLYYSVLHNHGSSPVVLLASQVRGLLASGLVSRTLDPVGLASYLWNGFVVGPNTLVKGVYQLPAGHSMIIRKAGEVQQQRYWSLPRSRTNGDPLAVRSALENSIEQHMISDVPVGVFLSGGKDSSAVATMASRIAEEPVKTFTITFEEAEFNEAEYAQRVADCIQSDHQEILLTESVFKSQLDSALASIDQPTFDGINSYLVSRAVKEAGLTVALAGTGGDELFGGYTSFRDLPGARRWSSRLGFLPSSLVQPLANGFARVMSGNLRGLPPQTRWGRLADALNTKGDMVQLYQVANAMFTRNFYEQLSDTTQTTDVFYGFPSNRTGTFEAMVNEEGDLNAISKMELSMFLGERLLRDTDAASMESSLEVRVPLIDHTVVEAVFQVEEGRRFKPVREKPLLREMAMWDLPDYVFDRPKLGFELPLDRWCREGLREQVGDVLCDESLCRSVSLNPVAIRQLWNAYQSTTAGLHWSRVWGLYVLLQWCRAHGVAAS